MKFYKLFLMTRIVFILFLFRTSTNAYIWFYGVPVQCMHACPTTPGRLGLGTILYLTVLTVTCFRSYGGKWRGFAIEVEEIWSGTLHIIARWKGGL